MNIGIDYLGYHLKQSPLTGNVELFTPAKKTWEFIREVRSLDQGIREPLAPHPLAFPRWDKISQSTLANLNSRLGFLRHSCSYCLRKKALTHFKFAITFDPFN